MHDEIGDVGRYGRGCERRGLVVGVDNSKHARGQRLGTDLELEDAVERGRGHAEVGELRDASIHLGEIDAPVVGQSSAGIDELDGHARLACDGPSVDGERQWPDRGPGLERSADLERQRGERLFLHVDPVADGIALERDAVNRAAMRGGSEQAER